MSCNKTSTVRFMAPLALANVLNPLNSTMMATAIVPICLTFKQTNGAGALLIVPLYLTSAIGQPFMGRLSDLFSARKINALGFAIVFLSALIGVFAQNFTWLIVSRILLGLGSSAAYPSSMTLIRHRYAGLQQQVPGSILAALAMASQATLAVGPFLGGFLIDTLGWQSVFFVNIPLVITGLVLLWANKKAEQINTAPNRGFIEIMRYLDVPGMLLFTAFLVALLLTLLYPGNLLISIPAIIAGLAAFIMVELKQSKPFINVRVLAINGALNSTFLRQMLINVILYMMLYGLPQWLEQTKKISPANVGLMMLPLSLAALLMSFIIAKNKNYVIQLITGIFFILAASVTLFFLDEGTPVAGIISIITLLGCALGILTVSNQATLYAASPEDQIGVSSGLYRTVSYIGAIFAGSRIKHVFEHKADDAGLHSLGLYSVITCAIIIVLIIPVYFNYRKQKNEQRKHEYK